MDRCYKCMPHWSCDQENKRCEPKQTNADRIRAMSDEELAGQFVQIVKEAVKAMADFDLPEELLDRMWSSFYEKLKQPAEGE